MAPSWEVVQGDSVEVLRALPDASIDAVVCDPPAGIAFMGKAWDRPDGVGASEASTAREAFVRPMASIFREVYRVLKPGGHALVWALPRTQHWTATAVEDAGFDIRDVLAHNFLSGFPKSLNVSITIDKAAGAMGHRGTRMSIAGNRTFGGEDVPHAHAVPSHESITDAARTWSGWGTALKPSHEAWILARRPLEGTVAANVLKHGTGALNVDGCRVASDDGFEKAWDKPISTNIGRGGYISEGSQHTVDLTENKPVGGRWPPNMLLSHGPGCVPTGAARVKSRSGLRPDDLGKDYGVHKSGSMAGAKRAIVTVTHAAADGTEAMETWDCEPGCPVAELDRQSGISVSSGGRAVDQFRDRNPIYGGGRGKEESRDPGFGDTGGASRMFPRFDYAHEQAEEEAGVAPSFHYFPKPSRSERESGCDDLPARSGAASVGRKEGSPGTQSPRAGAGANAKEIRNIHPTVKSIALMRWLCRLVTPPGGTVLDPFTGSGTTGCAAVLEGFDFVGIEREEEYAAIARSRIGHWASVAAKGEPPPKVRRPREPKPEVAPPPVEVAPPPPIVPPAPVVTPSPPPKKKRKTETSTLQIPFLFSTQETP